MDGQDLIAFGQFVGWDAEQLLQHVPCQGHAIAMLDGEVTIALKRFVSMPALTVRVLRLTLARVLLDSPEHSATSRSALLDAVKEPVMVSPIHVRVIQAGRERYVINQCASRDVCRECVLSPRNIIGPH